MESLKMRFLTMNRRAALRLTAVSAFAAAVAPVGLFSAPAHARDAAGDRAVLEGLLRTHVAPRVAASADAASALKQAVERLASAPDGAALKTAREAFFHAMDAWAAMQHLRPGPLLLNQRADRLFFWPDKRSVGGRQLGQLLTAKDESALAPGAMGRQSAAVQGYPALERLLFEDGVDAEAFGGGAYRGKLAAAVAANIAVLSAEVRDGWAELATTAPAGVEQTAIGKGPTETLNNLFMSLVTAMQVAVDQKLLIPLGGALDEAKPALAEAVRSGRSLKQLAGNLAGVRAMLLGENGGPGLLASASEADRKAATDKTVKAFDAASAAVAAVPEPLDRAVVDKARRGKVEAAFRAAKAAQTVLTRDLPPLLNITLGFNELDGD